MGMDGLSFSNTGAIKESTSAELTSRTEQIIQTDPTNDMKQVQTLSTNRRVREKDEEEENQKNINNKNRQKKNLKTDLYNLNQIS